MSRVDEGMFLHTDNQVVKLMKPSWPTPANVHSVISTRQGGFSLPPYSGLNLGDHVEDDLSCVLRNRELLARQTEAGDWHWLDQVHGTQVVKASTEGLSKRVTADGVYTRAEKQVCAVLTADCLPVLFCDERGKQVASVHAGWRGLAFGILGNAIKKFDAPPSQIMAYLGPAISIKHFEVGEDVFDAFLLSLGEEACFFFKAVPAKVGHYLADLYGLARLALKQGGVTQVFGDDYCTYIDKEHFFSYRRDGTTGRMVSAIWLD